MNALEIRLAGRLWSAVRREAKLFGNFWRRGTHQLSHATRLDRYPALFDELASACQIDAPRILSFGCASGEECVSLKKYFPNATIVGADISETILAAARDRWGEVDGVQFCHSDQQTLREHGPFDIICCLSVLCRHRATRRRRSCQGVYPFERFDAQCRDLTELLSPGGLLAIYNSNFRFGDASVQSQFLPLEMPSLPESGFVVKFDKRNQRLPEQDYPYCVFQKLA